MSKSILPILSFAGGPGNLWWTRILVGIVFFAAALSPGEVLTASGQEPVKSTTTQDVPPMTLDGYAAFCAESEAEELAPDATYGALSAEMGTLIELLASVNPPPEVADLHNALLVFGKAYKELADSFPEDEVADPLFMFELTPQLRRLVETTDRLAPEVREQLVAAGCLSDDNLTLEDIEMMEAFREGDFGNDESSTQVDDTAEAATERETSETPEASEPSPMSLDDYAAFCAEHQGAVIAEGATNGELAAEVAGSIALMETINPPPEVAELHYASLAYAISVKSIADSHPQDEVANPAHFLVLVPQLEALEGSRDGLAPEVREQLTAEGCLGLGGPSNVTFVVEKADTVVSWDSVVGAAYYKVYHDDFFDSSCQLSSDGSPSFCDELAANMVETTYRHVNPDDDRNYYWVVACNRGGCSPVDSENPASRIGVSSAGQDN